MRELAAAGSALILLSRKHRPQDLNAQANWVELDLTDTSRAREVVASLKPKILIHLAGTSGRRDRDGVNASCEELNFHGTVNLLRAAGGASVRRSIIVGSAEEYGDQPGPLSEALPLRATSEYGISKANATKQALRMHSEIGCPVIVIRPFTVYGPGQPRGMFVADAVESAVRGSDFRMSLGEQKRDFVFVEDVVRGLIAATTAPGVDGRVINLGSGESHRLRDVAARIWEITSAKSALMIGARSAPRDDLYDTWADITLARRLLGWRPRVDLEAGLERTVAYAYKQLSMRAQECRTV